MHKKIGNYDVSLCNKNNISKEKALYNITGRQGEKAKYTR